MFAPKSRVVVTTNGQTRKAMVTAKVNDVSAYHVRYGDGTRAVVKASQIQSKVKGMSA